MTRPYLSSKADALPACIETTHQIIKVLLWVAAFYTKTGA